MRIPWVNLVIGTLAGLLAAGGLIIFQLTATGSSGRGSIFTGEAAIGGPFSVVDHTGTRFTEADLLGSYSLIYFGFTYCPDICPTELQVMATAIDQLQSPLAEQIKPIFATIDPARDTPEVMGNYVTLFSERMIGLTGTAAEIGALAQAYRVYYARQGDADDPHYLMDHSSFIYLMDPSGKFVDVFPYGTRITELTERLRAVMGAAR
jgi:protein SCO1/2